MTFVRSDRERRRKNAATTARARSERYPKPQESSQRNVEQFVEINDVYDLNQTAAN